MNKYYVYIHFRKDNLQPFYVGKGKGKRHLSKTSRNPHWRHIVNKVGYISQIMENNLTEEQSFTKERYYIEVLGRENLTNMTDGGDGTSGYKFTNTQKKKLSELKKGEKHPLYGKKHNDDAIKKNSESQRGDKNHNFGKNHSEETKLKMSFNNPKCKKIINIETGEIYQNVGEVIKILNIPRTTLRAYLNGRLTNKTTFRYL